MSNSTLIKQIQGDFMKKDLPRIETGMEVEVHQIIKEGNKSRIQKFKGLVIKTAGKSEMEKTITVRRKFGAFGVEKIFAIHSSTIDKIEVVRKFKVRRKSIKFIRDLTGKAARLKEVRVSKDILNAPREIEIPEIPKKPGAKVDAPKAEEVKDEEVVETPVQEEKVEKTEEAPKEEVVAEAAPAEEKVAETSAKEEKAKDLPEAANDDAPAEDKKAA